MTQATTIIFLAEYPMFGDAEPEEWIKVCLEDAKRGELIFDYKFVYVFDGLMTKDIFFEFTSTVVIPETNDLTWMDQSELVKKEGKVIADAIVNDSDTEIRNFRISF